MPKLRRAISAVLAIWLCVMLVAFTYTWVSRNWTPSIKGDDINIASSGALVISILGDNAPVYKEVSLNDVVGLAVDNSFTFKQVSSQDGENFFWKDFSPTVNGEDDAIFYRVDPVDTQKKDYIEARFCLKLDDSLETAKYIFIHPETIISYFNENPDMPALNKAIRISLTYTEDVVSESGTQTFSETVILADLGENNNSVVNAEGSSALDPKYLAVLSDADGKTDADNSGALGYQTVYGLEYFNCGRTYFDKADPFNELNYSFTRDPERALFTLNPGEQKWIDKSDRSHVFCEPRSWNPGLSS